MRRNTKKPKKLFTAHEAVKAGRIEAVRMIKNAFSDFERIEEDTVLDDLDLLQQAWLESSLADVQSKPERNGTVELINRLRRLYLDAIL